MEKDTNKLKSIIFDLLHKQTAWDATKVSNWYLKPNPNLDDKSPKSLIESGKADLVLALILII